MKRAFEALRRDPDPSYDVVVIGAGIGGLTCATLLAREKLRVLLVEQHYMTGGYCSTFRRKGYTFDAATHFYPLLGNSTTLTGDLLRTLGIGTRWIKMDPVDQFHFADGTSFAVPADFETYLARVKSAFPHEAGALDRFFTLANEAYLYGLLRYFRGRAHPRLAPLASLTLRDVLEREIGDPRLRLLLAADCGHWGSPPSRTSFVFDSMLRMSYFLGNYYPEGGSQAFADELARRFVELGGHVLMRATVERIVVEDGRATGVDIARFVGPRAHPIRVRAGAVVSNADMVATFERLLAPHVDATALARVKRLRPTYPCFLVHIGLQGVTAERLGQVAGYHWAGWDAERMTSDMFKIFVPTLYEPAMAPPGGQVVILQKPTDVAFEAVEDWSAHKAEVERDLLHRLDRVAPGITAAADVVMSASALTSHRFTLNYQGAMLGWEMAPDQIGDDRPDLAAPVDGVYLVGHWTQPGGGITPVIISALQGAQRILGA